MRQEFYDARALEIMRCAEENLTVPQAAARLSLCTCTVRKYAKIYGIDFRQDRVKIVKECAKEGLTRSETAEKTKFSYSFICQAARKYQIEFRKEYNLADSRIARIQGRADVMAALYKNGYTLQQIGEQFNITRERVRQIISKIHGLKWADGGKHVSAAKASRKREAKKDAVAMKKWGCTYAEWCGLVDIGKAMMSRGGRGRYTTPTGAYRSQKNNAKTRGVPFELTLTQWWEIWQASGHWEDRGRGQGYVMCRVNDEGPYAVGNVYIDTAINNSSEAPRKKKSDLPTGVREVRKGNYRAFVAYRQIGGVKRHLGSHKTPELAHAAYLMAGAA
jgi:hypothetical protein